MDVPSLSIARTSLTCLIIIYCAFVSASSFTNPTTEFSRGGTMLTIVNDTYNNSGNNRDRSNLMVREEEASRNGAIFDSTVCEFLPDVCKKMRKIKEYFFPDTGEFEARGPKDLIAIISTIFAAFLGAILVKLNVLIVLSLISVGIGKLLLILLALKTKLFSTDHTHQHQPFVYEKVYYPRHHYHDIPDQHEYPSEMFQEYSPR